MVLVLESQAACGGAIEQEVTRILKLRAGQLQPGEASEGRSENLFVRSMGRLLLCFAGKVFLQRHHEYQGHWLRAEVLILFEIPPQDVHQLFAGKLNLPWLAIQGRLMSPDVHRDTERASREISVGVRLRGGGRSLCRTRLSNKIPC